MMRSLVIFSCLGFLITACCTTRGDLFVSGTVTATIVDGQFKPSSNTPKQAFFLKTIGDTFRIADRMPFKLSVADNINLGTTTIRVDSLDNVTAGSRRTVYRGTLVETCNARVRLDTKCQRVKWYNPYTLPEVSVSESYPHQVVITPIVSSRCKRIGYEIRLGDTRVDGCESPALEALNGCRQPKLSGFSPTPPPAMGSHIGLEDMLF